MFVCVSLLVCWLCITSILLVYIMCVICDSYLHLISALYLFIVLLSQMLLVFYMRVLCSLFICFFFLMIRRPPRSTRTDTLFPYTTLFRSVGDAGQLAKLKSQGVLVDAKPHCSPQSSRRVDVEAPKESWSCKTRKTSLRNLALAFGLRLLWSWRVRHSPFKRLLELQHRLSTKAALGARPFDRFRLDRIISAFEIADLLVGSHDRCLERSFALAAACRRQSFDVTIVIGIQGQPFAAHCWVQLGPIVLNEKPDAVGMFSPILVL